jgi:hypothetical protein
MVNRSHGCTTSGKAMIRVEVDAFALEAVAGDDVDERLARRGRRGRLPLGRGAAPVESVRLDQDLRGAVASQAQAEGVSTSGFIGKALGNDLFAAR